MFVNVVIFYLLLVIQPSVIVFTMCVGYSVPRLFIITLLSQSLAAPPHIIKENIYTVL